MRLFDVDEKRSASRERKMSENETMEDAPSVAETSLRPASECFQNVNRRIRHLLRKNKSRIPIGLIQYMEDQIVEYFTKSRKQQFGDADEVCIVWVLPSSFDRLLAHGLCQFYSLESESADVNGRRQTHVRRGTDGFVMPSETLSRYLKSL